MGITNMIEYIPLGTIDRIGSSCHYLKLDEWGLLLDAGLDPDPTAENPLPDYDIIKDRGAVSEVWRNADGIDCNRHSYSSLNSTFCWTTNR